MDNDSCPHYLEVDSASNGLVGDIRAMKEEVSYHVVGAKQRIIVWDESHMISTAGQNALLQMLEEGRDGVLFIFATTEAEKMLPTIRSRCVELSLKLLTTSEIYTRLKQVVEQENIKYDEKGLRIISSYVRGHMRDALVLIEQLIMMSGEITEQLVRTYLRLDKLVELYEFLTEKDQGKMVTRVEAMLCQHSPGDLAESLGQVMVDAYKVHLGVGLNEHSQVDLAWLKKVVECQGPDRLLERAEKVLQLHTDFATIQYGVAAILRVFSSETSQSGRPAVSGRTSSPIPGSFRKSEVNRGE